MYDTNKGYRKPIFFSFITLKDCTVHVHIFFGMHTKRYGLFQVLLMFKK